MSKRVDEMRIKDCCGCRACQMSCPVDAISMGVHEDGFRYPYIDEKKCISCYQCTKACPSDKENRGKKTEDNIFFGYHKDSDTYLNSSSGGAFTAICQAFCGENDYVIFGAQYDKDLNVVYGYTNDIRKIGKFRKSKYVESNTNNMFPFVKKFLTEGKRVVFSGLPCHVAALHSSLGADYPNLLLVEIMCRGVISNKVYRSWLKYIELKYHSKVRSIDMRTNDTSYALPYQTRITLMNNKILENNDAQIYYQLYRTTQYYRKSCYTCKYQDKEAKSNADITIGDCNVKHGITNKRASLIILQDSNKIDINKLKEYIDFRKVSFSQAIKMNIDLKPREYDATIRRNLNGSFLFWYRESLKLQVQKMKVKVIEIKKQYC